jgi:transglutaminase-like putative cysteine protease
MKDKAGYLLCAALFIFLFAFCSVALSGETKELEKRSYANKDAVEYTSTSIYDIDYKITLKKTAPGNISKLIVRVVLIQDFLPIQEVLDFKSSPSYSEVKIDKNGNKTAFYNLTGMGDKLDILLKYRLKVVGFKTKKVDAQGYEGEEIPDIYVLPEETIESDNPKIVALAESLCKDKASIWDKTQAIYDYVRTNVTYSVNSEELGALYALENGTGNCSEFASLMMALCRAARIPARRTESFIYSYNAKTDDIWHSTVEVYMPSVGWVRMDPTVGQPRAKRDLYFAGQPDSSFILSILPTEFVPYGSWWDYNYWCDSRDPELENDTQIIITKENSR